MLEIKIVHISIFSHPLMLEIEMVHISILIQPLMIEIEVVHIFGTSVRHSIGRRLGSRLLAMT